jgi:hypothetical protein
MNIKEKEYPILILADRCSLGKLSFIKEVGVYFEDTDKSEKREYTC